MMRKSSLDVVVAADDCKRVVVLVMKIVFSILTKRLYKSIGKRTDQEILNRC